MGAAIRYGDVRAHLHNLGIVTVTVYAVASGLGDRDRNGVPVWERHCSRYGTALVAST